MPRQQVRLVLLSLIFLSSVPAWPCSVVGGPTPPEALVARADVIVRVSATGYGGAAVPSDPSIATPQVVAFNVLELIKGDPGSKVVTANGILVSDPDPNDRRVPYDFVRPQGRRGNCFALQYREGTQYLLLLKRRGDLLTPYWSALAPTNEELTGVKDPWLLWVKALVPIRLR